MNIEDFPEDGAAIPFSTPIYGAIVFLMEGILATVFLPIIIYAMQKSSKKSVQKTIITLLCFFNLAYSILVVVTTSYNLAKGGFALGKSGCSATTGIILASCGMAVVCLVILSADRFLKIVPLRRGGVALAQDHLTVRTAVITVSSLLLFFIPFTYIPLFTGRQNSSYELSSCRLYCDWNWSNNSDVYTSFLSIFGVVLLCGGAIFTVGVYAYIIYYVRSLDRQNQFQSPQLSSKKEIVAPKLRDPKLDKMRKQSVIGEGPQKSDLSDNRKSSEGNNAADQMRKPSPSVTSSMRPSALTMKQKISMNGIAVTFFFLICWYI